jgi:hypothetical protein
MNRHKFAAKCFLALLSRSYAEDYRTHTDISQEAYYAADNFMLEEKIRKAAEAKANKPQPKTKRKTRTFRGVAAGMFAFLLLVGCDKETGIDPKSPAAVTGQWTGIPWYCSTCPNPPSQNSTATLRFSIMLESETLKATNGKWTLPSCSDTPGCGVQDWIADVVTYNGSTLYIHWVHGYEFSGTRIADGEFRGVVYQVQTDKIIWNDNVTLIRQ